jgi:predicted MPP superfamily phosphohydrolase
VVLVGVDNITKNPYFRKVGGDLGKALEGVEESAFKILLSHDPTHWRMEVLPKTDIGLTLSGHTHGLKYKLTGLHPSHWRLHESGGLYEDGAQKLYVTPGLGSAFAFRLGGYPNVDILTLKPR